MSKVQRIEFALANEPIDKTIISKTEKAFENIVERVRVISRVVRDQNVQEVASFILSNLYPRVIEQQNEGTLFVLDIIPNKPIEKNYSASLPIVFFIERVNFIAKDIGRNAYACYCRNSIETDDAVGNFIVMRNPAMFSILFQATTLFHEAKHALDHRKEGGYSSWDFDRRERPAHSIELVIMKFFGGRKLARIAEKHKKIFSGKNIMPNSVESGIHIRKYDKRLDDVFGKALSKMEENLRMDRLLFGFVCKQ